MVQRSEMVNYHRLYWAEKCAEPILAPQSNGSAGYWRNNTLDDRTSMTFARASPRSRSLALPALHVSLPLHGCQDLKSRDDIAECYHQAGATNFFCDGARSDADFTVRAFVERPTGLSPFIKKIGY